MLQNIKPTLLVLSLTESSENLSWDRLLHSVEIFDLLFLDGSWWSETANEGLSVNDKNQELKLSDF